MSQVEISRKELLTREEAARRLSTLAAALADGESVEVPLGASTVKMEVPDHVRCKIEVEVDDDEVELEVELKWPTVPGGQDKA
jgi:amphi-Trp domain-containing protein